MVRSPLRIFVVSLLLVDAFACTPTMALRPKTGGDDRLLGSNQDARVPNKLAVGRNAPLTTGEALALLGLRTLRGIALQSGQRDLPMYISLGSLVSELKRCNDDRHQDLDKLEDWMRDFKVGQGGRSEVAFRRFRGAKADLRKQGLLDFYRPCAQDDDERWIPVDAPSSVEAGCKGSIPRSKMEVPDGSVDWSALDLVVYATGNTWSRNPQDPIRHSRATGVFTRSRKGIAVVLPLRSNRYRLIYWLDPQNSEERSREYPGDKGLIRELLALDLKSASFPLFFGIGATEFSHAPLHKLAKAGLFDNELCLKTSSASKSGLVARSMSPPWETISIDQYGVHTGSRLRSKTTLKGIARSSRPVADLVWTGASMVLLVDRKAKVPVFVGVRPARPAMLRWESTPREKVPQE